MKTDTMNICLITDKKYAKYAAVTIFSVIKNADFNSNINFYILHTGLSNNFYKKILKFQNEHIKINLIDVSKYKTKIDLLPRKSVHITKTSYYKFFIADIFNDLDKILYLDGDIIVNRSINTLYNIDIEDYLIGAVEDVGYTYWSQRNDELKLKFKCINSGVMLINCKKWREENLSQKLLLTAQNDKEPGFGQDQPVFNIVCRDKIKFLDFKYNVQDTFMRKGEEITYREDYKQAVSETDFYTIMHWTYIRKPWNDLEVAEAYTWWNYYMKTPIFSMFEKIFDLDTNILRPILVAKWNSKKDFIKQRIRRLYVLCKIILT